MRQVPLVLILLVGLASGFAVGAIYVRVAHAWRDLHLIRARAHRTRHEAWLATGMAFRLGIGLVAVVALLALTRIH